MAKILLIDDDAEVLRMLQSLLRHAGHEVLAAAGGRQGLELFAAQPVDCVVTDIVMPDVEGLELIHTIHQQRPELPIIAISGGGFLHPADYLRMAEKLGAQQVFAKPVPRDELLQAIALAVAGPTGQSA